MSILEGAMLWHQYEIALDGLRDALRDCPDALWTERLWPDQPGQWVAKGFGTFWYLGYHALFWMDLYLTGAEEGFRPPAPFDLVEMYDNEVLPRVYAKTELLAYVEHCRQQGQATLSALTPEAAKRWCKFGWGELTFAELQLYAMRHVVEHAGQLQLFISMQGATPTAV